MVSDCSWHIPDRTQSDLAGFSVSSSAHVGKAHRKPGEVPWWNVLISLPAWVSSLNWCLCLAAGFIPKISHTEGNQPQNKRFQLPRLGMKITQALVTGLVTLWFLIDWEAKGQECHHHFLARAPQSVRYNFHSTLGNLFTPTVKICPFFLPEIFVQIDFQSKVEITKVFSSVSFIP